VVASRLPEPTVVPDRILLFGSERWHVSLESGGSTTLSVTDIKARTVIVTMWHVRDRTVWSKLLKNEFSKIRPLGVLTIPSHGSKVQVYLERMLPG
jgi:hypothetical protein